MIIKLVSPWTRICWVDIIYLQYVHDHKKRFVFINIAHIPITGNVFQSMIRFCRPSILFKSTYLQKLTLKDLRHSNILTQAHHISYNLSETRLHQNNESAPTLSTQPLPISNTGLQSCWRVRMWLIETQKCCQPLISLGHWPSSLRSWCEMKTNWGDAKGTSRYV